MKANSNIYPYPQRHINKFRAIKKKKKIRKKARDIVSERYNESSGDRVNLLSILALIVIFLVLFYLGPHS